MYNAFQLAKKYIHYYCTALNGKGHGMHSPFVFQFILDVLANRQGYMPPGEIEALRKNLKRNHRLLAINDLGAGSRSGAAKQRTIAHLAATAVKPKKYGTLLYRLVKKHNPETIIELGTSLGISTAYMAKAATGKVYTIEGSEAIYKAALDNFAALGITNVAAICGSFEDKLPPLLAQLSSFDLAYVDGNHRYEPTMQYFEQLLLKKKEESIIVFDDIHWSAEMEKAWAQIKTHSAVTCTVDIFFMGFVFFRPQFRQKQHFVIRF